MESGLRGVRGTGVRQGARLTETRLFELVSRGGFVARAVVYGLIGVLAVKLALGDGGRATSQQGALEAIGREPAGKLLLLLTAVGLGGYASWRLLRALIGHGPESGRDSLLDRVGGLGSGAFYAILCGVAAKILAGSGPGGGASKETGGVLGWPAGRTIVIVAGLVLIGVAGYQAYRGVGRRFLEDAKTERMNPGMRKAFTAIGMIGHLARGLVFALVGVFLIKAAVEYNPKQAVGVGGALAKLSRQPEGGALLALVAAGLVAFALYSLTDARYHRV